MKILSPFQKDYDNKEQAKLDFFADVEFIHKCKLVKMSELDDKVVYIRYKQCQMAIVRLDKG
tara:strand:+ start:400 stop:585 length:186 start_codon:yes stop_codon:yes gene_type:complete